MTALTPGKRYAFTYEITVRDDGGIPSWLHMLERSGLPGTPAHIEQLPDAMPQWQVGDVIAWDEQVGEMPVLTWDKVGKAPTGHPTVRHVAVRVYTHSGKPYWRDAACQRWSAPTPAVPDEYIADLWNEGRLELVARDGRPWPKP